MIHYTTVKTNMFNGITHPAIAMLHDRWRIGNTSEYSIFMKTIVTGWTEIVFFSNIFYVVNIWRIKIKALPLQLAFERNAPHDG
jgi:hypothetical protein